MLSGAEVYSCSTPSSGTTLLEFLKIPIEIPIFINLSALVLGTVGVTGSAAAGGRLRGIWFSRLAILSALAQLLMTISLPMFLGEVERSVWTRPLKELHQVELRYRALYPKVGYSIDLESLGPPPAGRPPSAERAGLIDAELASGRYCHGKILLHYALRRGADGAVAGYTIRAEWAGRTHVRTIDETGTLRSTTRKD